MAQFDLVYADGRDNPSFAIPSESLNNVFGTVHSGYLGLLQRAFGYYGIHEVNTDQTHKSITLQGSYLSVVKRVPCVWDPTKTVVKYEEEIRPSKLQVQEEYCMETDWGGAFAILKEYRNSGTTGDQAATQLVADEVGESVGLGVRVQTVCGSLHAALPAVAGTDAGRAAAWLKGRDAHIGTAQMQINFAASDAAKYGHMNQDVVFPAALDPGNILAGNPETWFDEILANAKMKLQNAVNQGGLFLRGRNTPVVIKVSPIVFAACAKRYNETSSLSAQNRQRFTRQTVQGMSVLYFDQMPIMVEDAFGVVDDIVGKYTAAITISVAGNEGIGSSFSSRTAMFPPEVAPGLIVQLGTDVRDDGKLFIKGDHLVSSSFANTELIAGAVKVFDAV